MLLRAHRARPGPARPGRARELAGSSRLAPGQLSWPACAGSAGAQLAQHSASWVSLAGTPGPRPGDQAVLSRATEPGGRPSLASASRAQRAALTSGSAAALGAAAPDATPGPPARRRVAPLAQPALRVFVDRLGRERGERAHARSRWLGLMPR